ncbi:MAG: hypothetical protein JNL03_12180, partial [Prolixibacteraceae bacterium]|nr:hypothetical protein [Prolixibacteraceae bacterium]
MKKSLSMLVVSGLFILTACQPKPQVKEVVSTRWNEEQAQRWATENDWLRGSNFNPSTAINQLETWQAESFDTATISRELGWAEAIGMNAMRVYL